jgi:nucleotide-binding universal stress UspA family protein
MRNVLVPVDFSDTSMNAVTYATKMLTGVYGVNLVLYHMYEKPEQAETAWKELKKLRASLFDVGIVKTIEHAEPGRDLTACLEKFVKENKIDLVIMGIKGRTKLEQKIIGNHTLELIYKNLCPVLIVPASATFNKLKNIVLASDFTQTPSLANATTIKNLLSDHFARLHVVNVNPAHYVSITDAYRKVKDEMNELFKGYEHDFHFIGLYDLQETMNMFVKDHDIDMIITLPKDHSWFDTLTDNKSTKKLSYQSTIPVLAIHQ